MMLPAAGWLTGIGAAALAAGGYHYAALWPASRIFGRSLVAGDDPAEIALTYDDGPNDPYTSQLMDVLARHQVRATFFVIGRFVGQKPNIVRSLHRSGHLIGCHTMTHPSLMYMRSRRIYAEMAEATAMIEDIIGSRVRFFRPPFGARNPAVFRAAAELRLTSVLWNVNARDWKAKSAGEIEARLKQGIALNQRAQARQQHSAARRRSPGDGHRSPAHRDCHGKPARDVGNRWPSFCHAGDMAVCRAGEKRPVEHSSGACIVRSGHGLATPP